MQLSQPNAIRRDLQMKTRWKRGETNDDSDHDEVQWITLKAEKSNMDENLVSYRLSIVKGN